jgi:hypothetical protein
MCFNPHRPICYLMTQKPRSNRAARWGNAIGQAGDNDLTLNELYRLY